MEEVKHVIDVLQQTKESLKEKDAVKLRELSNQTIHAASTIQDAGSIALAVLIYTLSKIVERQDYNKIKSWDTFEKIRVMACHGAEQLFKLCGDERTQERSATQQTYKQDEKVPLFSLKNRLQSQ